MKALFSKQAVCVFSGFRGQIFYQGKPASGAKIVRHWSWKNEKGDSDETVTNAKGEFSFDSQWDTMRQILPVQFVAQQSIFVFFREQQFQIWGTGKLATEEFSEFGCEPKNFHCELTESVRRVDLECGFVGTNCHWE